MTGRRTAVSLVLFALVALAMALMQACGGGSGSSSTSGRLRVALTDKNSDDFKEVWISIRVLREA